jgi:endonuclease-3
MKRRRSGASTSQTTRLISQRSSANPAVTLVKLEDPSSCLPVSDTRSDPEPVPVPLPRASTARRSKRIKVEELAEGNNDDAESSILAPESLPTSKGGKGKGKRAAARPPTRTPPSRSATASPQKQKTIKQVLERPHPAPARWRETYDAIKEMRARFPAPVDTMGCDTAKWKEADPRVRAYSKKPNSSS